MIFLKKRDNNFNSDISRRTQKKAGDKEILFVPKIFPETIHLRSSFQINLAVNFFRNITLKNAFHSIIQQLMINELY